MITLLTIMAAEMEHRERQRQAEQSWRITAALADGQPAERAWPWRRWRPGRRPQPASVAPRPTPRLAR